MLDNIVMWSGIGLNVLILIVSVGGFIKITRNDLVHLERNVKEIKNTLSIIDQKLDSTSERISKQEGKCSANHG